jgi:MSHA biogenesis protein MshN
VVVEGGMSVINKMLQDLDRRQALGAAADPVVRPQATRAGGREWFWRVLVVLLTAALAWMGWVAVQLLPRKPLATELAFQAAAEAQTRAAAKQAAPPPVAAAPAASAAIDPAAAPAEEPKPAAAPAPAAPAPSDALRLALQLETPVRETQPEPVKPEAVKVEPPKPAAAKPKAAPPQAAPAKGTVDKRDRARSAADTAEAHFRRAALLLNHGRVSEAQDQLVAALRADASHAAARQAYVAVLLEQQRVDMARRVLQEGLAMDPEQPTFALALARIHTEQRDYLAALEVMERAGSVARNADFQALRGAVLQRLSRHGDAVEAYQNALRGGAQQQATTWIGFGISLEALGRRNEAVQAYRRALAEGPIAPEAREYAQGRARALE